MTTRPLYDILGLEPNATTEAIEAAYRKLAKQHHPDRNLGDEEAAEAKFIEVTQAYEVLADPIRRARYDRDGTFDNGAKVDHAMLAVIGLLSKTLITVLSRMTPEGNVREAMIRHLGGAKNDAIAPLSNLKKARKQVEKLSGRFTTDGEQNLMEEIVNQHLGQMQTEIDRIEADATRFDRAIEVLKTYTYRFDKSESGGLFMPGSWRGIEFSKVDGEY